MATRSTLSANLPNAKSIYCHWDGYPENMLPILNNHYDTDEKVLELLALGDLSSLGERVKSNPNEFHSFGDPLPDVTVAYHRDRGEKLRFSGSSEMYNYIYDNGSWSVKEGDN